LAAEGATALASLDQEWNATLKKADPNDPTVAAKFREERVEPVLEKLAEAGWTEGGQRFAEGLVARTRNHFFEKTTSDMSDLAGIAAKQNIATLTNQLSNAVINDPSSLNTSLSMVEHSIGSMVDSSPNITGVQAAKAKADLLRDSQATIVKAAAMGAIAANPEEGLKKFSGPEYSKYISGAELRQLEQQAKAVERARRVDENYLLQNQKLFQQQQSDEREGQYLQKLHSDDPNERNQVSAKAIANDFTLSREARERMIGIVERETKPEAAAKISNATTNDLIRRIRLPVGDPERMTSLDPAYDALEKGKLNKSDLKFVREEFANMRTPEGEALSTRQADFIASVKPMLDKSNPLQGRMDPSGAQQLYGFTVDLKRKIDEYKRTGKDPYSLMDPRSPDYMGSPAALAPYQKSLTDSVRSVTQNLRRGSSSNLTGDGTVITGVQVTDAPVKPRQAGETPDAYLKRLGYK